MWQLTAKNPLGDKDVLKADLHASEVGRKLSSSGEFRV